MFLILTTVSFALVLYLILGRLYDKRSYKLSFKPLRFPSSTLEVYCKKHNLPTIAASYLNDTKMLEKMQFTLTSLLSDRLHIVKTCDTTTLFPLSLKYPKKNSIICKKLFELKEGSVVFEARVLGKGIVQGKLLVDLNGQYAELLEVFNYSNDKAPINGSFYDISRERI